MMEWIEYMTSDSISPMANLRRENGRDEPWKVTYLGIGNENWGCGGHMRAEYYADVYRQFQTFAKNYGSNRLFKIACGASASDYHWTDTPDAHGGLPNARSVAALLHPAHRRLVKKG
jgi:alpha-L-arabinofuranosidase